MQNWAGTYALAHVGVISSSNVSIRLPGGARVQPDQCLRFRDSLQRGSDGYAHGVPELVIEIAVSSLQRDLELKRPVYERAGVREYIVWDVDGGALTWFRLGPDGRYAVVAPDADGVIESAVFPGLRLPVKRLLAGDYAALRD